MKKYPGIILFLVLVVTVFSYFLITKYKSENKNKEKITNQHSKIHKPIIALSKKIVKAKKWTLVSFNRSLYRDSNNNYDPRRFQAITYNMTTKIELKNARGQKSSLSINDKFLRESDTYVYIRSSENAKFEFNLIKK